MLTPYNPLDSQSFYEDYYDNQVGSGVAVYRGKTVMEGSGLGSMFAGLLRSAAPVLKRAGKSVGKRLLATGMNLANDALAGENIRESAKKRFKAAGRDLLTSASSSLMGNTPYSSPPQPARPVRKRAKAKRKQKGKGLSITPYQGQHRDIFA